MNTFFKTYTSESPPSNKTLDDLHGLENRQFLKAWNKVHWHNLFSDTREYLLIVTICKNLQEVAAFLLLDLSSRPCAHLLKMLTRENLRRRGLGSKLFYQAKKELCDRHIHSLAFEVEENNKASILFYESLGCHISHRIKKFYGNGADAFVYSATIRPTA